MVRRRYGGPFRRGRPCRARGRLRHANKDAAIYRFTQLTTSQTYPAARALPGLDPDAVYEVSPLEVSLDLAKQDIGNGQSPLGWWTAEGVRMTGRALASYGIRPPLIRPRPCCSRSFASDGLVMAS